ncbi:MAG: dephospho-CoA kinase, partial [Roseiflexaceae bacterium]|nr:dephospho-CoA kinase [Roseiflexaceae bacterium]
MTIHFIGLTGNIACGKSTVLGLLEQRGAAVIDADKLTHELQQPGQLVYAQIVAAFGPDILAAPAGPLDRKRLASIVFGDPAALKRLEAIVHPAVRARIFAWIEQLRNQRFVAQPSELNNLSPAPSPQPPAPSVAVLDAIKLLESGWGERVDAVWVVTCTPQQQMERLVTTRGMSEDEARMRIA